MVRMRALHVEASEPISKTKQRHVRFSRRLFAISFVSGISLFGHGLRDGKHSAVWQKNTISIRAAASPRTHSEI